MEPINPILLDINVHFFFALLIAGILSAIVGFLIGAPVLKLKGDYLAIATLGFSEIISVVFTNTQTITNGALGLKGIPQYTNQYWSWGVVVLIVLGLKALVNSSYGRAFKAIREDETAAQAMGINLFKHKTLSFTISAFIAGIGGALLANLNSTIDPTMFRFFFTYQILLIVVLGGMGSITGSMISACVMTVLMEMLRVVESPMKIGFISLPGISGMRMVVYSMILILVVLFLRQGIMGEKEISWNLLLEKGGRRLGNIKSRQNNY
jgi:branched-chain amino acid transport system permease protein